jgi:hypothetical protein
VIPETHYDLPFAKTRFKDHPLLRHIAMLADPSKWSAVLIVQIYNEATAVVEQSDREPARLRAQIEARDATIGELSVIAATARVETEELRLIINDHIAKTKEDIGADS